MISRREFLVGTIGTVGSLLPRLSYGQKNLSQELVDKLEDYAGFSECEGNCNRLGYSLIKGNKTYSASYDDYRKRLVIEVIQRLDLSGGRPGGYYEKEIVETKKFEDNGLGGKINEYYYNGKPYLNKLRPAQREDIHKEYEETLRLLISDINEQLAQMQKLKVQTPK